MDKNTKTTVSSPMTDAPQAFREVAEKGTTQAKEAYEKMSAATTEAADLIKNSYFDCDKGCPGLQSKVHRIHSSEHPRRLRLCPEVVRREVAFGVR